MRPVFTASVLALALAALAPSAAFAAADLQQGENIARRWCAPCHLATPDQKSASADVAPFMTLARSKTDRQLAAFLADPHPKMPNLHLSRQEIADLVAYIRSLAPAKAH
jgi:mono/diheme cytochrome c family protein